MKELSIEEKAKAYDEAIEKARIWKDKSGMPKDKQGILDDIFPELRESEDERIRKTLINMFNGYNIQKVGDFTDKQCIAWLEKQGEKEYDWSEESYDDAHLNDIVSKVEYGLQLNKAEINWLKSLKDRVQPQSQWKPSDEQMNALEESIMFLGTSWVSTRQFALESLYQDLKKLSEE